MAGNSQADLNAKALEGKLRKRAERKARELARKAKGLVKDTWSRKLFLLNKLEQQLDTMNQPLTRYLNNVKAVRVQLLNWEGFVWVNSMTRPILEAMDFDNETRIFRIGNIWNPGNESILREHQFLFK